MWWVYFPKSMIGILLQIIGFIPIHLRVAIGGALGSLFGLLPTRERKIARLQLRRFLPIVPSEKTAQEMFHNFGVTLAESLNLGPILSNPRKYIDAPPDAYFKSLQEPGRPIVVLTAHLGNWDLLAAFSASVGAPVVTIGRPARNQSLQRLLTRLRARHNITTIWRDSKMAARGLVSALKEGKIVAALIDQDTEVESTFSVYFGRPAATPSSIVKIAKRYRARILVAFLVRINFLDYKIIIDELDDGMAEEDILASYHRRLEQLVRIYPSQWVWNHKRWRTLPSGERLSTERYLDLLGAT